MSPRRPPRPRPPRTRSGCLSRIRRQPYLLFVRLPKYANVAFFLKLQRIWGRFRYLTVSSARLILRPGLISRGYKRSVAMTARKPTVILSISVLALAALAAPAPPGFAQAIARTTATAGDPPPDDGTAVEDPEDTLADLTFVNGVRVVFRSRPRAIRGTSGIRTGVIPPYPGEHPKRTIRRTSAAKPAIRIVSSTTAPLRGHRASCTRDTGFITGTPSATTSSSSTARCHRTTGK